MSASAHVLPGSRNGQKMGDWKMVDTMIKDGLWCASNDYHMGMTAENIASQYGFSREAQDEFAAGSQQKTEAAQKAGAFNDEIIPVVIPQRKGDPLVFNTDEFPRAGTTAASLGKLRPAFKKDGYGNSGQRFRHQRRCCGSDRDDCIQSKRTGPDPNGSHRGIL